MNVKFLQSAYYTRAKLKSKDDGIKMHYSIVLHSLLAKQLYSYISALALVYSVYTTYTE